MKKLFLFLRSLLDKLSKKTAPSSVSSQAIYAVVQDTNGSASTPDYTKTARTLSSDIVAQLQHEIDDDLIENINIIENDYDHIVIIKLASPSSLDMLDTEHDTLSSTLSDRSFTIFPPSTRIH